MQLSRRFTLRPDRSLRRAQDPGQQATALLSDGQQERNRTEQSGPAGAHVPRQQHLPALLFRPVSVAYKLAQLDVGQPTARRRVGLASRRGCAFQRTIMIAKRWINCCRRCRHAVLFERIVAPARGSCRLQDSSAKALARVQARHCGRVLKAAGPRILAAINAASVRLWACRACKRAAV